VRSSSQAKHNAPSSIAKPQAASSKHAKQQPAASRQKQQQRAMSGLVPQACRDANFTDGDDTKQHSPGAYLAPLGSHAVQVLGGND
jgi:hypothetical protein